MIWKRSSMVSEPSFVAPTGRPASYVGWVTMAHLSYELQAPIEYPSVVRIDKASPADRAGVLIGDVIVAINGADMLNDARNANIIADAENQIRIRRGNRSVTVTLVPQ